MSRQIGTMICCLSCRTVVWAYDGNYGDARGLTNEMNLPCPKCGVRGNYDGWAILPETMETLGTYDTWSTMEEIARRNHLTWDPSGDNSWDCEPSHKLGG